MGTELEKKKGPNCPYPAASAASEFESLAIRASVFTPAEGFWRGALRSTAHPMYTATVVVEEPIYRIS